MSTIQQQITLTLGDQPHDYDIPAIESALIQAHGPLTDIDDVPSDDYWAVVRAHEVTAGGVDV